MIVGTLLPTPTLLAMCFLLMPCTHKSVARVGKGRQGLLLLLEIDYSAQIEGDTACGVCAVESSTF